MDTTMDDQELHDPGLDALLRPVFVVEPPAAVQQRILAAVLLAADPSAVPVHASQSQPGVIPVVARTVSPLAYVLLGAALLAYAGLVSWVQGVIGDAGWLSTLFRQLLVAADLLAGQNLSAEPFALAGLLIQTAPWLLLLPLAWLLWERDRSAPKAS